MSTSAEIIYEQNQDDPFANETILLETSNNSIYYPDCVLEEVSLRGNEIQNENNNVDENGTSMVDNNEEFNAEDTRNEIILCVLWHSGFLGAAYYNTSDLELYVINDVVDLSPDYFLTRALYKQLKPSHTITIGKLTSNFVQGLSTIAHNVDSNSDSDENENETTTSYSNEQSKSLPPHVQLLKKEEYSFELCEHNVKMMRFPGDTPDMTDEERLIRINSLISFERKVSIHALGALLLFLNKYQSVIQPNLPDQNEMFQNLNTVSIKDHVLIDDNFLIKLQIFNQNELMEKRTRWHKFKRNHEDGSLFKLFDKCRSVLGRNELRYVLMHPTNSINILSKRHEFIAFCLNPENNGIVNSIRECLKYIFPISSALQKLNGNIGTLFNWKTIYTTLHNIILLQQLCLPYVNNIELFFELNKQIDDELNIIKRAIFNVIDFENSNNKKINIKVGVDEELDERRRFRMEIREKITCAATREIQNLPPYVKECSIMYVPSIGYLVSVKKWDENADYTDIEQYGFSHKFKLGNTFNFKSNLCYELDGTLGDVYTQILDLETQILHRLAQEIVQRSYLIKRPLKIIALLDCLISMAETANELGYIRPNLVLENVIDVRDCRHPILELSKSNYVPNSIESGGGKSLVKIITGPNNSGKSVYLKQIALIVYMVHIGSYVPARSATVGMMHSIHCCINSDDFTPINSGMSTFVINMRQLTQTVNCSKHNSLIIIDELGRATTETDGLATLTSYLEHFLLRNELCPHILLSTHYTELTALNPESNLLEHFKCNYKIIENDLTYLYKIEKGVSNSFGIYLASKTIGFPSILIQRSKQILDCLENNVTVEPINVQE